MLNSSLDPLTHEISIHEAPGATHGACTVQCSCGWSKTFETSSWKTRLQASNEHLRAVRPNVPIVPRVFKLSPLEFATLSREEQKRCVEDLIRFWGELSSPLNRATESPKKEPKP